MKIRKLEIIGFKSFVDRTVISFDHSVTAIVGPNGCGKSNVVDAIKWAMGEQAASRLRGKSMDDVIFNGCETRGPHGFAEVSVTFDNTDGLTPPEYKDYAEITVTRRLDRLGNSDYLINKTPVRLLDVTNLFLGTGVGRQAYSIIEQGRIGYIVSSKAEDRRTMIEEAAGVTKFKARKRAAERKIEQTRQNLLRVSDIVNELEKNLASLQRQAQKAERYKRYRGELRDLELYVASHKWLERTAEAKVVAAALAKTESEAAEIRSTLRVREAEVEAERIGLDQIGAEVDSAQNRAYELDNRVTQLESELKQQLGRLDGLREQERIAERELQELREQRRTLSMERDSLAMALSEHEVVERAEARTLEHEQQELERRRDAAAEAERTVGSIRSRVAEATNRMTRAETVLAGFARRRQDGLARAERLRSEAEKLDGTATELTGRIAELEARLEGLRGERVQTAQRKAELEQELVDLRAAIRISDAEVEKLRELTAEKRSRLRSLRELHQRFEGVGAGVRALMTRNEDQRKGVLGLVADRIECPPHLTRALAGALGERLQFVLVDDVNAGLSSVDFLRDGERGRATMMPQRPRRVVGEQARLDGKAGVVGCLADAVSYAPADEGWVRHLLGDVFVVEEMSAALRLHQNGAGDRTLVTLEGDLLRPDGAVTGGAGDDVGTHMLELKREMRELESIVAELDDQLGVAVARHGELRKGIAQRQASIDAARTEAHGAELAIVTAEKDLRRAQSEHEQSCSRAGALRAEWSDLEAALVQADQEEAVARTEIDAAQRARDELSRELDAATAIYQERRQAVDLQASAVTEVHVRAARARERADGDRQALDRLSRSIDELTERESRLLRDVEEGARQQGQIAARAIGLRSDLVDTATVAADARDWVSAVRARYDEARQNAGQAEIELKQLRTSIDGFNAAINQLMVRSRELEIEIEHLLEHADERHRIDLHRVIGDYHHLEIPGESVMQRIEELHRLVERMGEINLLAIEEFSEKSQRYEFLKGQKDDLEQALVQLERAIRQMNRESRRMFQEAFEAVNERFKVVFPQLFQGGRAELRLTAPEDLLETGIDIIAQPPGKRLGRLELMSGGEKALTAVALIFSLFQYRPSPFCLLDEVDAPLDEANVGRFAEAVRQMTDRSQFIVITHSKRTMEFADRLYGVTMEQPGISKTVSVELRGQRAAEAGDATDSKVHVA